MEEWSRSTPTACVIGEDEEERRPQTYVSRGRIRLEDGLYSEQQEDCKEGIVSGNMGSR